MKSLTSFLLLFSLVFSSFPFITQAQKLLTITVLLPNGGEKLVIGQTYKITWEVTGNISKVGIVLYQNQKTLGVIARDLPADKGFLDWKLYNINPGQGYKVGIHTYPWKPNDPNRVVDYSDGAFSIIEEEEVLPPSPPECGVFIDCAEGHRPVATGEKDKDGCPIFKCEKVECRDESYECTTEDIPCCAGLKEVSLAEPNPDGSCNIANCGSICRPCGNGICDSGENRCNCPEDCKDKEEKVVIKIISPQNGDTWYVDEDDAIKFKIPRKYLDFEQYAKAEGLCHKISGQGYSGAPYTMVVCPEPYIRLIMMRKSDPIFKGFVLWLQATAGKNPEPYLRYNYENCVDGCISGAMHSRCAVECTTHPYAGCTEECMNDPEKRKALEAQAKPVCEQQCQYILSQPIPSEFFWVGMTIGTIGAKGVHPREWCDADGNCSFSCQAYMRGDLQGTPNKTWGDTACFPGLRDPSGGLGDDYVMFAQLRTIELTGWAKYTGVSSITRENYVSSVEFKVKMKNPFYLITPEKKITLIEDSKGCEDACRSFGEFNPGHPDLASGCLAFCLQNTLRFKYLVDWSKGKYLQVLTIDENRKPVQFLFGSEPLPKGTSRSVFSIDYGKSPNFFELVVTSGQYYRVEFLRRGQKGHVCGKDYKVLMRLFKDSESYENSEDPIAQIETPAFNLFWTTLDPSRTFSTKSPGSYLLNVKHWQ